MRARPWPYSGLDRDGRLEDETASDARKTEFGILDHTPTFQTMIRDHDSLHLVEEDARGGAPPK